MTFEHTRRTLAAMRLRTHAALLALLTVLLVVWCGWLVVGRMAVYVRSDHARLEVTQSAVPINAPTDGVITWCDITLGRRVNVGEPLLRLDARTFELQVDELRSGLNARKATLASLRNQLTAEEQARETVAQLVTTTERAGRARVGAGRASSDRKAEENAIMARMRDAQLTSKLDAMRTSAEAEALRMQVMLAVEQAALDSSNAKTALRDRDVRIVSLRKDVVDAENEIAVQSSKLQTLQWEVDRRTVRAVIAGTLTDVVPCSTGGTLTSTFRVATLLPDGEVRVVAYFSPSDAVGRVLPGQRVIVRVENFPWTQFGTIDAVVTDVGSEPRDGLVRAEMRIPQPDGAIPALHGLIASAEVETEHLSPAALLLRLAGRPWTAARASPQPAIDRANTAGPAAAR